MLNAISVWAMRQSKWLRSTALMAWLQKSVNAILQPWRVSLGRRRFKPNGGHQRIRRFIYGRSNQVKAVDLVSLNIFWMSDCAERQNKGWRRKAKLAPEFKDGDAPPPHAAENDEDDAPSGAGKKPPTKKRKLSFWNAFRGSLTAGKSGVAWVKQEQTHPQHGNARRKTQTGRKHGQTSSPVPKTPLLLGMPSLFGEVQINGLPWFHIELPIPCSDCLEISWSASRSRSCTRGLHPCVDSSERVILPAPSKPAKKTLLWSNWSVPPQG